MAFFRPKPSDTHPHIKPPTNFVKYAELPNHDDCASVITTVSSGFVALLSPLNAGVMMVEYETDAPISIISRDVDSAARIYRRNRQSINLTIILFHGS